MVGMVAKLAPLEELLQFSGKSQRGALTLFGPLIAYSIRTVVSRSHSFDGTRLFSVHKLCTTPPHGSAGTALGLIKAICGATHAHTTRQ